MSPSPALQGLLPLASNEPTVLDITLAKALGYERPNDIRKLIKRHVSMPEAMGSLRHRGAMIVVGKGAVRAVTEYHLTKAQAAFIVAKADTKRAASMTAHMAEVFAMYSDGRLVGVDADAAADLQASQNRAVDRLRAIHIEEREARSDAFKILARGRVRRRRSASPSSPQTAANVGRSRPPSRRVKAPLPGTCQQESPIQ